MWPRSAQWEGYSSVGVPKRRLGVLGPKATNRYEPWVRSSGGGGVRALEAHEPNMLNEMAYSNTRPACRRTGKPWWRWIGTGASRARPPRSKRAQWTDNGRRRGESNGQIAATSSTRARPTRANSARLHQPRTGRFEPAAREHRTSAAVSGASPTPVSIASSDAGFGGAGADARRGRPWSGEGGDRGRGARGPIRDAVKMGIDGEGRARYPTQW